MNLLTLPAKVVRTVLRGLTCTHRRMGCPGDGNGNYCKAPCGHWACPDCGLSWDDGAEK